MFPKIPPNLDFTLSKEISALVLVPKLYLIVWLLPTILIVWVLSPLTKLYNAIAFSVSISFLK